MLKKPNRCSRGWKRIRYSRAIIGVNIFYWMLIHFDYSLGTLSFGVVDFASVPEEPSVGEVSPC